MEKSAIDWLVYDFKDWCLVDLGRVPDENARSLGYFLIAFEGVNNTAVMGLTAATATVFKPLNEVKEILAKYDNKQWLEDFPETLGAGEWHSAVAVCNTTDIWRYIRS